MARKIKVESEEPTPLKPVIRYFPLSQSLFYTVGVNHDLWKANGSIVRAPLTTKFVRIFPPPDSTDEDIENAKKNFPDDAVFDIKPRPRSQVVVNQATTKYESSNIRKTVEDMVAEANSQDRSALEKIVQEFLSEVCL